MSYNPVWSTVKRGRHLVREYVVVFIGRYAAPTGTPMAQCTRPIEEAGSTRYSAAGGR